MTEILQPYSVSEFNKIPDLYQGTTAFHAKDGMRFVNEVFGPLVLKHGLEAQLGITILHRHFDLKDPEKLVEFNNISLPWKNQDQDDSHSGGKILPNAWLLNDGKLMPYEFFFSPFNQVKSLDLTQDKVRAFLDEFVKAAKYSSLDGTVALKMFPGPGFRGGLEFSEDRANIVLKPGQYKLENSQAAEVTWYFERGWVEAKDYCVCTKYFKHHYHTLEKRFPGEEAGQPASLK
ncbi:hypothetical protein GJ744_011131 [Endocarpon pusillum]|uniref:Uncharacterized protein n=1 Tax=Endocarpon pusillum TaxID=364733 RepID=A0A8H7E329_9EURO|nr:hypothetical protein GJ744_011131 [Endocarpon pusillum]